MGCCQRVETQTEIPQASVGGSCLKSNETALKATAFVIGMLLVIASLSCHFNQINTIATMTTGIAGSLLLLGVAITNCVRLLSSRCSSEQEEVAQSTELPPEEVINWAELIKNRDLVALNSHISDMKAIPAEAFLALVHEAEKNGDKDVVDLLFKGKNLIALQNSIMNAKTIPVEEFLAHINGAAKAGEAEIVELLLLGRPDDAYTPDKNGHNLLHKAILCEDEGESLATVNVILQQKPVKTIPTEEFLTYVHEAALSGNAKVVELFLKARPEDAYKPDDKGKNVLHKAISCEDKGKSLATVNAILKKKAVENIPTDEFLTYIHAAASSGNTKIVELLLTARPEDAQKPDQNGNTILHNAIICSDKEKSSATMLLILQKKPELLEQTTKQGLTPLLLAATPDVSHAQTKLSLLIGQGAKPTVKTAKGNNALHCHVINVPRRGHTPNIEVIELLVNHGAKLHELNSVNKSPWQLMEFNYKEWFAQDDIQQRLALIARDDDST